MPAPLNNTNALKTGAYSFLRLRKAPKGKSYLWAKLRAMNGRLCAETAEKYGQISVTHAMTIRAIVRYEMTAQLLEDRLAENQAVVAKWEKLQKSGKAQASDRPPMLTGAEEASISREINTANAAQAKAMDRLKLDAAADKPVDAYRAALANRRAQNGIARAGEQ